MTKRIVEISQEAGYLKFSNQQLIIESGGSKVASIPIEDLSVVILDNPQSTVTQVCMRELVKANIMLICSDEKHLPIGMLLPIDGHSIQTERFNLQATMPKPLQKQLWKQIVCAKVLIQAKVLNDVTGSDAGISQLARKVKSGDPDNIEAQAAKRYWPRLFDDKNFRRNREKDDQNRFLNYGYAILRALVARNIVATGLHPSIGLHHHNRYNSYPLADDVMEPFRPYVDLLVWQLLQSHSSEADLDKSIRKELLSMVKYKIFMQGETYTLQGAITKAAQSLSKAIAGETKSLVLPG